MTNLYEGRQIIHTCIKILLLEINKKYPDDSYGFMASHSDSEMIIKNGQCQKVKLKNIEPQEENRRYRIYKRLVATYFPEERYNHRTIKEKSVYIGGFYKLVL